MKRKWATRTVHPSASGTIDNLHTIIWIEPKIIIKHFFENSLANGHRLGSNFTRANQSSYSKYMLIWKRQSRYENDIWKWSINDLSECLTQIRETIKFKTENWIHSPFFLARSQSNFTNVQFDFLWRDGADSGLKNLSEIEILRSRQGYGECDYPPTSEQRYF